MKLSTILALPLLSSIVPAAAQVPPVQSVQMVPRPIPDADALAAAMRRIGANPRDLGSLIEAGELSLKLGDATAAASLFKRAEQIDPMNGRVKAGMARILVQQERPGEALRYFDQAAGYGLDARSFAGDRGLAYDLIGEQTRAQRDYRLALASGPQAEVQRRYALSLAISGRKDEALAQIDPLVRQSDRGAWRTRAFILAMGGDLSGATDIATRMMPPGMATGLQPFFRSLPTLGPVDRAFAVHFGEIRATPARLADARLAPALPALPPEPAAAPVTLAQAAAPVLRKDLRRKERERRQSARDRRREAQQRAQVVRATRPATAALPDAPRYGSVNGVTFAAPREVAQSVPMQPRPVPAAPLPTAPVSAAPVTPVPTTSTASAPVAAEPAPATAAGLRPPVQVASAAPSSPRSLVPATPAPAPRQTAPIAASAPPIAAARSPSLPQTQPVLAPQPSAPPRPTGPALATNALPSAATPSMTAPATASASPATTPRPGFSAAVAAADRSAASGASPASPAGVPAGPPVGLGAATTPRAVAATSAPVAPQMSEDSILARIIAGISIPAEELGVAPSRPAPTAVGATPAPAPTPAVAVTPARIATGTPAARPVPPAARPVVAKPIPVPTPTPRATPAVDPKVAARKAAADKKAAEAKKLADAEKTAAAKKLADEKKAAKADPPRIWVQVAGGANAGDLAKAWRAAQGKAAALNGKTAYSTPLRATNRVVTGPFKTDAEARAMVNTLARQGVSAFTFTSEAGQKMTRLSPK